MELSASLARHRALKTELCVAGSIIPDVRKSPGPVKATIMLPGQADALERNMLHSHPKVAQNDERCIGIDRQTYRT